MKIKFYEDPGHGWGAVKRSLLIELGIADKITQFSYQNGDTVYLEEDCDLGLFIDTLRSKGESVDYKKRTYYNRCPIRSYERYQA